MSYTAQLFDSLLRASAETPLKSSAPQYSPSADLRAFGPSSPSSTTFEANPPAEMSSDALPHELDECYAVIRYQRAQVSQLRGRVSALEAENGEVSSHAKRCTIGPESG
jgi:hypothetical protein